MKPSILLRVGAVLSVLYFLGHMMGAPWTPSQGPETATLLATMKSYRFDVSGSSRTYWDFYLGFGLIIGVHLLVQTAVLWQLGTLAKKDPSGVRPLVALFGLGLLANAVLVWKYFFAVPLILAVAIAICLGLAFTSARTNPAPGDGPLTAR